MSSTNKTTNYELSQFIGSDKPAWLVDYNGDMSKIDNQMKANADAAASAASQASSAGTTASGAADGVQALNTQINGAGGIASDIVTVQGAINTINALIGNGEPTTQDKTIIGAINELDAGGQTLAQKINDKYLIVQDDVDLAAVTADGVKTIPELLNDLAAAFITNCGTLAADERYEVIGMFAGGFGFLQSRNMILSTNALSAYGEEFTFTFVDPVAAKIEATHVKCDSTAANCFWRYGRVYDDSGVCKITTVADTSVPVSGTKYTLTGRKLKLYS